MKKMFKLSVKIIGAFFVLWSFTIGAFSALAQEKNIVVFNDPGGDRGLPTPYMHHKNGIGVAFSTFVFDALIWRDKSGDLIPALAESWTVSKDFKKYTFTINSKAKWHDGKPLTAKDAVFTFEYYKKFPYPMADWSMVDKISLIDDYKFSLELKQAFIPFLETSIIMAPVLPKHIFEKVSNPYEFVGDGVKIGSGPFKLAKFNKAQKSYQFVANQDYYLGKPKYDEIRVVAMQPPAAIASSKKSKDAYIISLPGIPKLTAMAKKSGLDILQYPMTHPVKLKFNLSNPLLAKVEVRRAIASSINSQEIVDKAYYGAAEVWSAGGLNSLAKDQKNYPKIKQYAYNPKALDPYIKEMQKHEWRLVTDPRMKDAALVISDELKAKGIKIKVIVVGKGAAWKIYEKNDYEFALVSYSVMGDPDVLRFGIIGNRKDGDNYFSNKKLVELLQNQAKTTDLKKRNAMLEEAMQLYAQDIPSISLVSKISLMAYDADKIPLYFPAKGIGKGIPFALDKMLFVNGK